MNPKVCEILNLVQSEDSRIRSNAVTDISFVLEIHAWDLSKDEKNDRYESWVKQEIIDLKLDEAELKKIVEYLKREIENESELSSSMLFAMGQAPSSVGLKPLLEVTKNKLDGFNENELYQAIISLEQQLPFEEGIFFEDNKKMFSEAKIIKKISRKMLSLIPVSHVNLESTCLRFLAELLLLLDLDQ